MVILKDIYTKPTISYWKSSDPCYKIDILEPKLTEINIIRTKNLTDDFVNFCIKYKDRIFLHVIINGMGKTIFEPHIPTVKKMFEQLHKLISNGFPQKQILVVVDPILPNDIGLNALKLLLRVFTEYKLLRLRFVRFNVLPYTTLEHNKSVIANRNITSRQSTRQIQNYLVVTKDFWTKYYQIMKDYEAIISIDSKTEALVGVRELMPFGINNEWINKDGTKEKIINYEKGNKFKPILNIISPKRPTRCNNRCLLCPFQG